MPTNRQQFGAWAEEEAAKYLVQQGFTILDRHVTSRFGELDLIAKDGDTVVAVEVRAKRSATFGTAIESLTNKKVTSIQSALYEYLEKHKFQNPIRIDVITFDPDSEGKIRMEHVRGVEEADEQSEV